MPEAMVRERAMPVHAVAATVPQAAAGVVVRAAVYGGSGYADGNLDVLAGLEPCRLPMQLIALGEQQDRAGLRAPARRRALEKLQQRRLNLAESVFYQSCPPPNFMIEAPARATIGRCAFETDALPAGWGERCNHLDQIWVPSTFNGESFVRGGVEPQRLRVLAEGVDTRQYRPGLQPLPIPGRRGFNFLSVFDWIDRKGWDVLLRAYFDAFTAEDDVALIVKTHKFDEPGVNLEERLVWLIEHEYGVPLERAPTILLLSGLLPKADMPRLYAAADAFVLPTRGEGWGRPFMEAAAAQMAVVATRWSGHLDFLNDGNSHLIDIEGVVPVPNTTDRDVYLGQGWAEPSAEHLSQILRQLAADPAAARQRARRARQDMVERWDRMVLAPQWAAAFDELLA